MGWYNSLMLAPDLSPALLPLLDNSHDLVHVVAADGRFTYVNQVWRTTLGYEQTPLHQLTLWNILPPAMQETYGRLLAELPHQPIRNHLFHFITRTGQRLSLLGNITPYTAADNGRTPYSIGFFRDVTLEQQAEQNTHRYQQQLTTLSYMGQMVTSSLDLQQVLQRVLDIVTELVSAEGVAVLLRQGDELVFEAVSGPGAIGLRHTRMPASEGIAGQVVQTGRSVHMANRAASPIPPYANAEAVSGFVSQMLLAVPIVLENEVIGVLEAANSQPVPFAPDALPLLESAANWAAIALHNAMLYETQKSQYHQLRQSQAQLVQAEKMAAVGRLAASIAHEINNPIQAIQGCITLTAEELQDLAIAPDQEIYTYLEIVQTELLRVAQIVRRMRDFYIPAPDVMEPVFLPSLIEHVLKLLQRPMDERDIRSQCTWSADLPLVMGIANHLKQVFLNLALNALDAMPHGGTLSFTADYAPHTTYPPTHVQIAVTDTGEGIPAELLPNVFEPFITTKPQGSGLGLSTTYGMIQDHQGRITVQSTLGQGTTFTIELPIAQ